MNVSEVHPNYNTILINFDDAKMNNKDDRVRQNEIFNFDFTCSTNKENNPNAANTKPLFNEVLNANFSKYQDHAVPERRESIQSSFSKYPTYKSVMGDCELEEPEPAYKNPFEVDKSSNQMNFGFNIKKEIKPRVSSLFNNPNDNVFLDILEKSNKKCNAKTTQLADPFEGFY